MNKILIDAIKTLKEHQDDEIEIVLNTNFGGFALSKDACKKLGWDGKECKYEFNSKFEKNRSNPELIKVVKEMGENSGEHSVLSIKKIKVSNIFGVYIHNYDGQESIEYSMSNEFRDTPLFKIL